jgi:hypothetical protein
MTGFIVCVFSFRNRVSPKKAFAGLEPGEGKLSRPVLRGLGSSDAARPLDSNAGPVVGSLRFLGFAANRSSITSLRLLVSRKLDSQSFAQWTKAARLEIVC